MLSLSVVRVLMGETLPCKRTGWGGVVVRCRDFVPLVKFLAGCYHPACDTMHDPFEIGVGSMLFHTDLVKFFFNSLSVILGCKFILIEVHDILLWRKPILQLRVAK